MVTRDLLVRCGRLGGAIAAGAFLGATLAGASSLPFIRGADLALITVPVGFLAGGALGLLARVMPEKRWLRRIALLIAGPVTVFLATLVWMVAISVGAGWQPDGFALLAAIVTTIFALPGTTIGAFVLEALLRGEDPVTAFRVHTLLRRLAAGRSAEPAAIAALDDRATQVRHAAAKWILERVPDAPAKLREWSARAEAAYVPEIALALAHSGSADVAEEMLLDVVERGDWHAQGAAIRNLGDVGGRRSLRTLQSLRDVGYHGSVVFFALEKILRRLPQTDRGQVSVAAPGDAAGHLSAPIRREGRLSQV